MKVKICLIISLLLSAMAESAPARLSPYERGRREFELGKYARALALFSQAAMQAQKGPDRNRAYYFLGLTFFEMGYYYSAYVSFRNVLLSGDDKSKEVYEKAIKNAVVITDRLNMVERVGKAVEKLPSNVIPSSVAPLAQYSVGVHQLYSGKTEEAITNLRSVNPDSQFYPKAQLYLGILATKQKNYKDATYYFQKVTEVSRGRKELFPLAELARLNLARTQYSNGDIEGSVQTYAQFLASSPYWLTVLLEASWPLMRLNDTTVSLGNLHTVLSPFYREDLVGEAYVLRATVLFSLCKYEEMRRTLASFFTVYDPVLKAMQAEETQMNDPQAFYSAYITGKGLSVSFLNYAKRDAGITNKIKTLKLLRDERQALSKYRRNEMIRRMQSIIDETDKAVSLQIGSTLQELHQRKLQELLEQREQANYLKVEIVTGEKELIEGQKGLPPRRIVDIETSVQKGYHFWPFVGEYWDDELGSYVYTTETACVN